MNYYIKADRYLVENGEINNRYLHVSDGCFGAFVTEVPEDAIVEDWSGYTIAPGLFDTHIHGIKGYDVMDGEASSILEIAKALPKTGVTRFLPTTLTSSKEALEKAIIACNEAEAIGLAGARSEGIYLEGPYFTEKYKGAQNEKYFRDPSYEEFSAWQALANGSIVKIAIAPERDGAIDFIKRLRNEDVFVSLGHTDAAYDCCAEAVDAGGNIFVHLFNGMSGLHHREPGVVGAALTKPDAYAELICDGHHVHAEIAKLTYEAKREKTVLITDCMRAGLMPDGEYLLGEFVVQMKDGMARTETGSLAGSTLQLKDGVKNLREWSGKSLSEVWHLASLSPAKSVGKEAYLGSITAGKKADYVVLDDALAIEATAINGKVEYQKNNTVGEQS